jgi:enterochelin esterase family protein
MQRVGRTDLFYRTYRLEPGGRWEYRFQVDFERWVTDPANARTVPAVDGDGQYSELVTAGYRTATHLVEPTGPRGRLDEFTLTSGILGYDKPIKVWLPPGYDEGTTTYPLLVVNDGSAWLDKGLLTHALDNLVGQRMRPVVVAFVQAYDQWWLEAGGTRNADYARMLVEELLPALGERYRLTREPASRAVMGSAFYGFSSAWVALRHPEAFGQAAAQSVYLGLGHGGELADLIRARTAPGTRFYLDWNRYDMRDIDRDWDFAADGRTLAGLLKENGYTVEGGEALDSAGWGSWRNRTDRLLTTLFPLEGTSP